MATDEKTQAVLDNIVNRRTIPWTKLKPDPIPEDQIQILLECANWAPTHKFTEPWRFTLFQGKGKARLAQVLATSYKETSGQKFNPKKHEKALARPLHVPLVIAVSMKRSGLIPEFEEMLAVGCSVQNLHLAASALGLGCSWSTPGYLNHFHIRKLLNLEEGDSCLGFLYLGRLEEKGPFQSIRKPVADKVTRILD